MEKKKYKKILIHKVIDTAEKYYTKKSQLFDLPAKVAVIGASQRSGKTNWVIYLALLLNLISGLDLLKLKKSLKKIYLEL